MELTCNSGMYAAKMYFTAWMVVVCGLMATKMKDIF